MRMASLVGKNSPPIAPCSILEKRPLDTGEEATILALRYPQCTLKPRVRCAKGYTRPSLRSLQLLPDNRATPSRVALTNKLEVSQ